jgi:hypothetical protein
MALCVKYFACVAPHHSLCNAKQFVSFSFGTEQRSLVLRFIYTSNFALRFFNAFLCSASLARTLFKNRYQCISHFLRSIKSIFYVKRTAKSDV